MRSSSQASFSGVVSDRRVQPCVAVMRSPYTRPTAIPGAAIIIPSRITFEGATRVPTTYDHDLTDLAQFITDGSAAGMVKRYHRSLPSS